MITAPTLASRARRTAAAAAGLGVAALLLAPGASATYKDVAPPPQTAVLGVKHSAPAPMAPAAPARAESLAYTGAEVGGAAAAGLALVAGGAVLLRVSRRRAGATA